jgi:UDP-glucose 4-epimerase
VALKYDRVLVTGGAGFIGSHTVDALLEQGVQTWVLDDLSSGSLSNLKRWRRCREFRFTQGSVVNRRIVEAHARRVDAIVHLAAVVSPYISVHNPDRVNEVNVTGTLNVLTAGIKHDVNRIVFASSSSVYGNQGSGRMRETAPRRPITPYGVSKLAGEEYCRVFHNSHGLPTISLRYFNVYGERQSSNPYSGVIAIFAKQLANRRRPIIYGNGSQTRDFVHVSDVARANLLALQSSRGLGEAFNIGTGRAISILQLHQMLSELVGRTHLKPIFRAHRPGDIRNSCADMRSTERILRFRTEVELRNGLHDLIDLVGQK